MTPKRTGHLSATPVGHDTKLTYKFPKDLEGVCSSDEAE